MAPTKNFFNYMVIAVGGILLFFATISLVNGRNLIIEAANSGNPEELSAALSAAKKAVSTGLALAPTSAAIIMVGMIGRLKAALTASKSA